MLVRVYVQMPQGVIILISAGRSVWAGVCIQTSDHFSGFHQLLISTGFSYISSALHTDSSVQGCVGGLGLLWSLLCMLIASGQSRIEGELIKNTMVTLPSKTLLNP